MLTEETNALALNAVSAATRNAVAAAKRIPAVARNRFWGVKIGPPPGPEQCHALTLPVAALGRAFRDTPQLFLRENRKLLARKTVGAIRVLGGASRDPKTRVVLRLPSGPTHLEYAFQRGTGAETAFLEGWRQAKEAQILNLMRPRKEEQAGGYMGTTDRVSDDYFMAQTTRKYRRAWR